MGKKPQEGKILELKNSGLRKNSCIHVWVCKPPNERTQEKRHVISSLKRKYKLLK